MQHVLEEKDRALGLMLAENFVKVESSPKTDYKIRV